VKKCLPLFLLLCKLGLACSCVGNLPPLCSRIDKIGVAFLGEILSSNDDGTGTFGQLTLERVRVIEVYKGLPDGIAEAWIDPGSMTSCYGPHQVGKRYLIIGQAGQAPADLANHSVNYRGEKKPLPYGFDPATSRVVSSMACDGSRIAGDADDEIAFLRSWKAGKYTPRVLGQLYEGKFWIAEFAHDGGTLQGLPLSGAKVTISGGMVNRKGTTNADGKFEFVGIPPGEYRVQFEHPEYGSLEPKHLTLTPTRACGWVESTVQTAGRLRIAVKGAADEPVPKLDGFRFLFELNGKLVPLAVFPASDATGMIDISGLSSGVYVIALNPGGASSARSAYPATYYPGVSTEGTATRIKLAPNEQRLDLVFHLPKPIASRKIFVHVADTLGRPVSGATVFGQSSASVLQTDDEGNATLVVMSGINESVRAWKEFETGSKPWSDWKRWRADEKVSKGSDDVRVEIVFREWKLNGEWNR